MISKILKNAVLLFSVLLLTGCWDYVGLDSLTIVTGIAIDKNKKNDKYELSIEVVDLKESSTKVQGFVKTNILESTGKTIFDAIRNVKKRTMNKLYFANAQVVVVSSQIAKEDGINSIINFFLRDRESRETISLVVSEESTAKELLGKDGTESPETAFEMKKIIETDNAITSSIEDIELYKVFNAINGKGTSFTLPFFHIVENDNKDTIEANGIAIFKGDKLIGKLNSTESKYYLFVKNCVEGGILTLDINNDENVNTDNVSLEIASSQTINEYSYKDGKYKFTIKVNPRVYLAEYNNQSKKINEKKLNEIEKKAEEKIAKNIEKIVEKAKNEFKTDIFDFGNLIYKSNSKLWKKIDKDWEHLFLNIEVSVVPDVQILNTALFK